MKSKRGYLLLEALLAIAVIAAVVALVAQSFSVSQSGLVAAGNQTVAAGLLTQTFSAVESVARADWDNIYLLNKGVSNLYHATTSGSSWALASGAEALNLGGVGYTNSFYLENVNRDGSDNIVTSGGTEDPSTEQVVATVSWPSGGSLTASRYLTRWPNQIQVSNSTDWPESATSSVVATDTIQLLPNP